jgi:hypothetical protein
VSKLAIDLGTNNGAQPQIAAAAWGVLSHRKSEMTRLHNCSDLSVQVFRLRSAFERGGPLEVANEIAREFPRRIDEQAIREFIVGLSPTQIRWVARPLLRATEVTDLRILGHHLHMTADDMPTW